MRRTGSPGAWALCVALLLVSRGAVAADVEFYQVVDRNELGTEDVFRLTIVSTNAPDGAKLKLPASDDFEILSRSQSTEMSVQMGTGTTTLRRTLKTVLVLRATRAGALTLPGAALITDGKTYHTDPISLRVRPGHVKDPHPNARAQPPDPLDPFRNFPRGMGLDDEPAQEDSDDDSSSSRGERVDIPRNDSDLFVRAVTDRTESFVGEQVTLTVWIYSRVDLSEVSALNLPKLDGFWSEDIDSPTQLAGEQKIINGIPYRAYLLKRRALFPVKAGTLTVDPVEVDVITGFLFANRRVHRKSDEIELKVKPLPSQGRPPGFNTNNVGNWRLMVEANQTEVELGQPVTVRVTLEGKGNLRNVALAPLQGPPAMRIYDPTTTDTTAMVHGKLGGRRVQEYLVMAQQTGQFTLPALSFHYFDPETGRYETSRTDPLSLSVRPGASTSPPPGKPAGNAPVPDAKNVLNAGGLRPLRYSADFTGQTLPVWRRAPFIPMVAAPLGLWLGALAVGLMRARWSREDEGTRTKKRARAARKRLAAAEQLKSGGRSDAFYGEVEKALMHFLEAKLGTPLGGLTREGLSERLREAHVPLARQQQVMRVLEACEVGRFAPGAEGAAREQVLEDAEAAMEGWEVR